MTKGDCCYDVQFLEKALLPLHKPKCVSLYHQQLSYCIIQYVEKDPDTAIIVLNGLIRYWPWSCSNKQVMIILVIPVATSCHLVSVAHPDAIYISVVSYLRCCSSMN